MALSEGTSTQQPTNMSTTLKYLTMVFFAAMAIIGCKPDEEDDIIAPAPVNEEELITTMILSFSGQDGVADKELRFTDADGDGGGAPILDLDTLQAGANYNVSILLLDASANPVDTISNEVLDEGVDHQFFFQPTGADITFAYADADANGAPIGLSTNASTNSPSAGTLEVTLRHQPDKAGAGVDAGDITNAGGETDIEVEFPLVIE